MRKADYSILAVEIRDGIYTAENDEKQRPEFNAGCVAACKFLAQRFASRASVDKQAFLKACGIE